VPQQVNIVYADHDNARSHELTELLLAAGFGVTVMTANTQQPVQDGFRSPDVVLLCDRLDPHLRHLTTALWPNAKVLVLADGEDYQQLPSRLRASLLSD
jgi:hypothetical protein